MTDTALPVFWPYTLRRGLGRDPAYGACAMAAISWLVHGEHGDKPPCACPVVGEFTIALNDAMPNAERQRLLPFLHRIAGSRSEPHERARLDAFLVAAARLVLPLALARRPLAAARLAAIPPGAAVEQAKGAVVAFCGGWSATLDWWMTAAARAEGGRRIDAAAALATCVTMASDMVPDEIKPALWDALLAVLDTALAAGPQGEPWSADALASGVDAFAAASGLRPEPAV